MFIYNDPFASFFALFKLAKELKGEIVFRKLKEEEYL